MSNDLTPMLDRVVARVSVAQTVPRAGDVRANLIEHLALARRAAELGAELVVFPELSLTGYELGLAHELAFRTEDARLDPLRKAATELGVALVVGAPVRVETGALHIGALAIAPGGGAPALYTKRHLGAFPPQVAPGRQVPPPEREVFAPGELDPELRVGSLRAALAVCADVGRPEHAARAAARGAELYLAGMFVIPADLPVETERLAERAVNHGMAVAMANFGGQSGGLDSAGASAIWSESGQLVARLGTRGSGVVWARCEIGAGGADRRWRGGAIELLARS